MKHNNQDDLLLVSVKSKSNDFRDDLVNATILLLIAHYPSSKTLKAYKDYSEERLKVPHRRLLGSTRSKV